MEDTCNKYLHSKILSVPLTSFYIFFLNYLISTAVSGDSPARKPPTSILLNCGSDGTIIPQDGRTWIGDIDKPEYFPPELPKNAESNISQTPPSLSIIDKIYLTARLSRSQLTYTFLVSAGQKFIRLYFHPASYQGFESSKAIFSVKAGSFTLLSNFNSSTTTTTHDQHTFHKEFCINVEEDGRLNITFTRSHNHQDAYAFINGIEISSMRPNLYYTKAGDEPIKFLGQVNPYRVERSNALETVYRINVGGALISPASDTEMYRTWFDWYIDYLTDARPGVLLVNSTISLSFNAIANYVAPSPVYKTAMSMGIDKNVNENYNLTWEFPVDSGFTYFVRLHFCEFQNEITEFGDRVFEIFIANQTAETEADVIQWSGGNGVPVYRDYAVRIGSEGNEKTKNLTIALHPAPERKTRYSDVILNGLEIFKVDSDKNLAGASSVVSPSPRSTKPKNTKRAVLKISISAVSSFVVVFILILFILGCRRKAMDSVPKTGVSMVPIYSPIAKSGKSRGLTQPFDDLCTHFSLSEIKVATNNFDDILVIGVGGFGNVYKGWFINNEATPIAIKRLNPGSQQGVLEFKTEIEMLSQLRHRHLVSLIGYCDDDGEMILIYDYMARGTLRDHLYKTDNPPLSWNQRLKICIGAAHGLNYLHTGAKHTIIHRDVKTTNILLDESWVAKVSDFGLSKIGPSSMSQTHVSTMVKGTFGYLDPDYFFLQELSEKSDVYSFGVVLFEVLCARPPVLRAVDRKQASLAVWAQECYNNGTFLQIVDPFLKDKIGRECLKKFGEVAVSCLHEDRNKRPSMSEVVYGLEFALQIQNSKEKDDEVGESDKGKRPAENYVSDDDSGLLFTDYLEY